jgi:mRNA interferase MazF
MERGEIWWADLGEPAGTEPGYRRPLLIVQTDAFNRSRLATTIAIVLTSNLRLADAPGNVLIPADESGLPKDSVVNVSQLVTLAKSQLTERVRKLPARFMRAVTDGLKLVLIP